MNKNMFMVVTFFVISITMLFSGCIKKNIELNSVLSGNLQMVGSSSMQEVCDKLANDFMKKYPKIDVVKSGTGSGEAPRVVKDGVAQIGDISRELTEEEKLLAPGTVLPRSSAKAGVFVRTSDGALEILEMQLPGGKILPAKVLANGRKINPYDSFKTVIKIR